MTAPSSLRGAAWIALLALAACGGPRGDWRAEYGRTTANPVVLTPGLPLVIPTALDLPAPGGANRATQGR